jgi:hypothetical protein
MWFGNMILTVDLNIRRDVSSPEKGLLASQKGLSFTSGSCEVAVRGARMHEYIHTHITYSVKSEYSCFDRVQFRDIRSCRLC